MLYSVHLGVKVDSVCTKKFASHCPAFGERSLRERLRSLLTSTSGLDYGQSIDVSHLKMKKSVNELEPSYYVTVMPGYTEPSFFG